MILSHTIPENRSFLEFRGTRIYASPTIGPKNVQTKFPKSKKARILKKFQKDFDNYSLMDQAVVANGICFVSPEVYRKLEKLLKGSE